MGPHHCSSEHWLDARKVKQEDPEKETLRQQATETQRLEPGLMALFGGPRIEVFLDKGLVVFSADAVLFAKFGGGQ